MEKSKSKGLTKQKKKKNTAKSIFLKVYIKRQSMAGGGLPRQKISI